MKNHLNKKLVVGYIGVNGVLAKSFANNYKSKFIFKAFDGDIRNYRKIYSWILKNRDINIFINFAAITSTDKCEKFKKKALDVNYLSPVKLMNMINKKEEKNKKVTLKFIMTTIITNDPYNTNILRKMFIIIFFTIYNILLYCKMYKKIQNIKFYKFL